VKDGHRLNCKFYR